MIDNNLILFVVLPLAAYCIGSTPFGAIIARAHKIDIRKAGSGNVGATNVWRVLGRKWGFLCFFLDVAKGLIPVLIVGMLLPRQSGGLPSMMQQFAWLTVGFAAIAGHVFSFWLKFRGGKGVATALGVVVGIFPYFTWPGLCAFGLWIAIILISRYVSLGSILAAAGFLPLFAAFNWSDIDRLWPFGAFAGAMVLLIIVRHRTNIARLVKGEENKIGAAKERNR